MFHNTTANVVGHLGRDPEFKNVGDHTVCNFSVASDQYQGKGKEATTGWFNVALWNKDAEMAREWKKGDFVHITGTLQIRDYETKGGVKDKSIDVTGRDFTNFSHKARHVAAKGGGGSGSVDPMKSGPAPDDEIPF